ncbi:hypothetical protein Q0812_06480 [Brevundimonas sp. 2R-24]|uniref:DUF308 domain-containing protein n=1 Tax=Peiella sedimenti TaxID=3061083 RepID=A0ABT8SN84_9CAUL|nr:hypothetical protein [Caulobacteraceae bacterium XZ-24]
MDEQATARRERNIKVATAAVLALAGGATGFALARAGIGLNLPFEDAAALFMAALLLVSAAAALIMLGVRPASIPKGCGLLQTVVLALAGVMFALPVVASPPLSPALAFALVAALLAVQSLANLMLWRRADEMLRRVMWETCAVAFWVGQLALFLYAAAARLDLVAEVSAWTLMSVLMALYILASAVTSVRRGLS